MKKDLLINTGFFNLSENKCTQIKYFYSHVSISDLICQEKGEKSHKLMKCSALQQQVPAKPRRSSLLSFPEFSGGDACKQPCPFIPPWYHFQMTQMVKGERVVHQGADKQLVMLCIGYFPASLLSPFLPQPPIRNSAKNTPPHTAFEITFHLFHLLFRDLLHSCYLLNL